MKLIKALWKTFRELDITLQLFYTALLCIIPIVFGVIIKSVIIVGIFGVLYLFLFLKGCWSMEKEDFYKFVNRVKENIK